MSPKQVAAVTSSTVGLYVVLVVITRQGFDPVIFVSAPEVSVQHGVPTLNGKGMVAWLLSIFACTSVSFLLINGRHTQQSLWRWTLLLIFSLMYAALIHPTFGFVLAARSGLTIVAASIPIMGEYYSDYYRSAGLFQQYWPLLLAFHSAVTILVLNRSTVP